MILYISCSVLSCLGMQTKLKEGFIHVSCNCKIFSTVSSTIFMRSIVSATFLLKYFVLSKCVRLFVCCAVAFDVMESLSNVGRVMVMFACYHSIYKSWLCVCYEKQHCGSFLLSRNIKTSKFPSITNKMQRFTIYLFM
jgi:hypothetical protein